MKLPAAFRLGLAAAACLLLPGCWDYERIDDRGQIYAIGVDPMQTGDKMEFTFQVPTFHGVGGSEGQSQTTSSEASSTGEFSNFYVKATSVDEAMSLAQTYSEKQLYLGNLQVVILNRALAKDQVQELITELIRNPQTERLAHVVTTIQTAAEVLKTGDGIAASDKLDQILGPQLHQHAFTTRERLWQFWRDSISAGVDPVTSVVETTPQGLRMDGGYAYRDLAPTMQLTPQLTLTLNAVRGRLQRANLVVQDGDKHFTVGNVSSYSRCRVTHEGQQFVFHVFIRVKGTLLHDESSGSAGVDRKDVRKYEAVLSQQLQKTTEANLRSFQKEQMDVFGFGRLWMIRHPDQEKEVQIHWGEDFQRAKVVCEVHSSIVRKGALV